MKDGIDTGQRAAHCLRRTDVPEKQLDAAFEITSPIYARGLADVAQTVD
jgi:hypothetical protein